MIDRPNNSKQNDGWVVAIWQQFTAFQSFLVYRVKKPILPRCLTKVLGCGGAAFIGLAACAENLETYLFGSAATWITCGTILALLWGVETFCSAPGGDDDR